MSDPSVHKQSPPPYSPPNQQPPGYGFQTPPSYPAPPQVITTPQNTGYGSSVITVQQPAIIINGCPRCRVGVISDEYSAMGICCAIFFFPLGVLCCLAMRERRCTNCHAEF